MAGSVILAGVWVYKVFLAVVAGCVRVFCSFNTNFSLLAVIYGSLTTCRQVDLKRITVGYPTMQSGNLIAPLGVDPYDAISRLHRADIVLYCYNTSLVLYC